MSCLPRTRAIRQVLCPWNVALHMRHEQTRTGRPLRRQSQVAWELAHLPSHQYLGGLTCRSPIRRRTSHSPQLTCGPHHKQHASLLVLTGDQWGGESRYNLPGHDLLVPSCCLRTSTDPAPEHWKQGHRLLLDWKRSLPRHQLMAMLLGQLILSDPW